MYTINSSIDMFQTMKRTLTDKIIVDENLNKIAHNFINAQTVFAKMLAKNTEDMTKYYIDTQTAIWFPKVGEQK